jgi:hypothetical protein
MALPMTRAEVEILLREFRCRQFYTIETMQSLFMPHIADLATRRLFPRRPHTDDMMQMLVDFGIEPPERNWISRDGLTFIWSKS